MKNIVNILAFTLLFSCGSADSKKSDAAMERTDTVMSNKILNMIDSARATAVTAGIYDGDMKMTFDSLQNKVMYYQLSVYDLIIVQNDLLKVQAFLSQRLNNAKAEVEQVKASKQLLSDSLNKSKRMYAISNSEVHFAKEEARDLKKKFSMPGIAGVSVKCYGFKTRFLKAPLQFETLNAKEIKRIIIQFIVPANEIIEKKNYVYSIKISGILVKSVILKLTGEEMPVEPITFDIVDVIKPGDHTITIDCNGENKYSQTVTFL